jgi:hypothetical protein
LVSGYTGIFGNGIADPLTKSAFTLGCPIIIPFLSTYFCPTLKNIQVSTNCGSTSGKIFLQITPFGIGKLLLSFQRICGFIILTYSEEL